MGIEVSWYNNEHTILLERFDGRWLLEDYYRMVDEASALLAATPHTVHIIVDASASSLPPSHMVSGMRYALKKMPANQGAVVFVGPGAFITALIELAKRFSPQTTGGLFIVATREEALALIAQQGGTAPNGT
jgi:hypothetical protein